jgi:hypothetical protein
MAHILVTEISLDKAIELRTIGHLGDLHMTRFLPDANPIRSLANLVSSSRLPMCHPLQAMAVFLHRGCRSIARIIVWDLKPRITEMRKISWRRGTPWRSSSRHFFVCWKFNTDQAAFWMRREQFRMSKSPRRPQRGRQSTEELQVNFSLDHIIRMTDCNISSREYINVLEMLTV